MKDESSLPPDFNPNYEERRKQYTPAKLRKGQPATGKAGVQPPAGEGKDVPAQKRDTEGDAAGNGTRKTPKS